MELILELRHGTKQATHRNQTDERQAPAVYKRIQLVSIDIKMSDLNISQVTDRKLKQDTIFCVLN